MDEILRFWWAFELFSPQKVPQLGGAVTPWRQRRPLPWDGAEPVKEGWANEYTVYVSVYRSDLIYRQLNDVFCPGEESFAPLRTDRTACAAFLVNHEGYLVDGLVELSAAAWGLSIVKDCGPLEPRRIAQLLGGFREVNANFAEQVAAAAQERGAGSRHPMDTAAMERICAVVHDFVDGAGPSVSTAEIRIKRARVKTETDPHERPRLEFLNSFHLRELETVRAAINAGHVGRAMRQYLTPDGLAEQLDRMDVVAEENVISQVVRRTGPDRMPWGRWPSNPAHHLAFGQQFAVDEAMATLGSGGGLMGVNGPPGTGKSTLLREIVAANVVERARQLAGLQTPDDAFGDCLADWKNEKGWDRGVWQLSRELSGFEMVVASSNNGAVENVSNELPARSQLGEPWKHSAGYFPKSAEDVLLAANPKLRGSPENGPLAWGLIAARLGNKDNRDTFAKAFWLGTANPDNETPTPLRITLNRKTPRTTTWEHAVEAFRAAEQAVQDLLKPRVAAQQRIDEHAALPSTIAAAQTAVDKANAHAGALGTQHRGHDQAARTAAVQIAQLRHDLATHESGKPSWWRHPYQWLCGIGQWNTDKQDLEKDLAAASVKWHWHGSEAIRLLPVATQAQTAALQARATLEQLQDRQRAVQVAIDDDTHMPGYPTEEWRKNRRLRELRAPWLDEELNIARSELFLAAMDLHRVFLEQADGISLKMASAVDVVWGIAPHTLSASAVTAAWQLLFVAVPVVSTTFASFAAPGAMFSRLGPESLGWLLIDEAGQVKPEDAVGAIWRSRRVLTVGDPRQLQPIVSMPDAAEETLARAFGVSSTWKPSRASVQGLADRTGQWGTRIGEDTQGDDAEDGLWVSAPLLVHRRCDEPMFSICNHIAYSGIMTHANECRCSALPESGWIDVPNPRSGTKVQDNEIRALIEHIDVLANKHKVKRSEIFVVSPFRPVVERIEAEVFAADPEMRGGTVHSVQGQEADAVILVLGGDPDKNRSREWAGDEPNLLNVAVSRAKHRFYVIGDRATWSTAGHFQHLAKALPVLDR
ncbi:DEAD/DEAH box helicase [Mycobacteroides chelonae]|uniref:DEAD/DEAH box helicase n=1 Tax=Mycobacteroides chelonae TaxID=1774 RepID=UPI001041F1CB|nr:DEAD/DEAH box helicase [Mycobacteroides chelonae]